MESAFEKIVLQSMHMLHMHISIIIIMFALPINLVIAFLLSSRINFQICMDNTIQFVACQHIFRKFFMFLLKNIKTNPCSFMTRARECVVQYHHKADETSNQQETRAEGDEGR